MSDYLSGDKGDKQTPKIDSLTKGDLPEEDRADSGLS